MTSATPRSVPSSAMAGSRKLSESNRMTTVKSGSLRSGAAGLGQAPDVVDKIVNS